MTDTLPPDAIPLSECQQGYLTATAGDPADPVHNTALPLLFDRPIAPERLRAAVAALIARHPILGTVVRLAEGTGSRQWVADLDGWWQEVDARGWTREAMLADAAADLRRPFVFERGLFRVTLYRGSQAGTLLVAAMHHLAADAATWGIFGRELLAQLAAGSDPGTADLPPLAADYGDFVRWERELLESARGRSMAAYWEGQLAGVLPLLQLPTDAPRPPHKTFNGETLVFALPADLTRAVHALSATVRSTRYAVLLAAYLLLLHRAAGPSEVWVLVPTSIARLQPRFAGTAGLFVSPAIVRLRLDDQRALCFGRLVREVGGQLLLGLHHQPYPVMGLLRGAAVRAMSAWERGDFIPRHFAAGDYRAERCDIPQLSGLYDLGLTFLEAADRRSIMVALSYNRDLFTAATAEGLAARYRRILGEALRDPLQPVDRLLRAAEVSSSPTARRPRPTTVEGFRSLMREGRDHPLALPPGFAVDPSDVLIASFPKCGTTWVQQIVHGLRTGGSMDFEEISLVVPWIETAPLLGIDLAAPQVAAPRAFKTHVPWDRLPRGGRNIFVVRDPGDTLVSLYRFMRGVMFEPGAVDLAAFADEVFLGARAGDSYWDQLRSWWPVRSREDVLFLCYDDLQDDLRAAVVRIAAFCGIAASDALIDLATAQARFAFMHAHADRFDDRPTLAAFMDLIGLPPTRATKVRAGRSGDGRAELPPGVQVALAGRWRADLAGPLGLDSYRALREALGREGGRGRS